MSRKIALFVQTQEVSPHPLPPIFASQYDQTLACAILFIFPLTSPLITSVTLSKLPAVCLHLSRTKEMMAIGLPGAVSLEPPKQGSKLHLWKTPGSPLQQNISSVCPRR